MKKIDKLIITSFLGPFFLTLVVVVFIWLNIHMLRYFDDIIGKDLGWGVVGTLMFYFAIFNIPIAMPLAVLLSSLITFGNLGEHFELTAIKSLGISLVRSLVPIFIFVVALTGVAFYVNNNLVPKAALEAYSLLFDVKQKKPALDLREGIFTSSIPDINIKINERLPDGKTLRGVIIYDHRGKVGNKEVTVADSGRMYTILNDQYLKLELFNGYNYSEGGSSTQDISGRTATDETLSKTRFARSELVFDLSSFGLNRTDKKWFQSNRIMRNMNELEMDMDSIGREGMGYRYAAYQLRENMFLYNLKTDTLALPGYLSAFKRQRDSIQAARNKAPTIETETTSATQYVLDKKLLTDSAWRKKTLALADSLLLHTPNERAAVSSALASARTVSSQLVSLNANIAANAAEFKIFQIQWHRILANSFACLAMFLIGAPLGSIIKKGGLGVPVLASILFFIVYYVLSLLGEKWAKQDLIPVPVGVWAADFILLVFGLIFLRQARRDARLFDADFYLIMWDRAQKWLVAKGLLRPSQA